MVGGPMRATNSCPPLASLAIRCIGKVRNCFNRTLDPSPSTATVMPECSATYGFGRATHSPLGRHSPPKLWSASRLASPEFLIGGPTLAGSCRRKNYPRNYLSDGSNTVRFAHPFGATVVRGSCVYHGVGALVHMSLASMTVNSSRLHFLHHRICTILR